MRLLPACVWRPSTLPGAARLLWLEPELSRGGSRCEPRAHTICQAHAPQKQPQCRLCGTQGGPGVMVRCAHRCTRAVS
eukprot:721709-Prymnesium_polylepis.1